MIPRRNHSRDRYGPLEKMSDWIKIKENGKEVWKWNNYISNPHEFLEERPWTPLVIDNQLCFSAVNNKKWKVVWGEYEYKEFEDVYDTDEYKNKPVYIARNNSTYYIVHGEKISQGFNYQITFRIENENLKLYRWDTFPKSDALIIEWYKI